MERRGENQSNPYFLYYTNVMNGLKRMMKEIRKKDYLVYVNDFKRFG